MRPPRARARTARKAISYQFAEGRALGDTTTLADANVVAELKAKYGEQ